MAQKQPFRSIEMRGRQSSVRSDLRAPDRTQQMAEFSRREMQKLQDSHEARNAAQRFQNFNDQVLEETAIQQQRLEAANLSTNATLSAQANEILGRQALEGQRMEMQQQQQIRNMRNAQSIIRNQLQQQISAQEAKSLSNFGNQLLNFSQTLYKRKAEEINLANQRLQAQGQLDGMLDSYGLGNEDLNNAQSARVATGMGLDNAARELDAEGRPNDATNIRSHNGFYTYGVQEGIAIKNGLELKGYLQQAKEDAIAQGVINFGDPNADQKLQVYLQDKTIDFMIERGLTSLPAEIQNKYLAKTLITAQSAVMTEFNDANQKFTIESSIGLVRNQIRTGSRAPTFAEDLPNMLNQLYTKDPENFSENLGKVFKDLKADTYESGDMTALDTLVTIIKSDERLLAAGQDVISDYLKYQDTFDKAQAKAADEAASELSERLKGTAQEELATITDVSVLTERRQYYWDQAENLPLKQRGAFREWLSKYNASDLQASKNSNDEFLSTPGVTPELIRQRIALNPGMPQSEKDRLANAAKSFENLATINPLYKTTLATQKLKIQSLRPSIPEAQLNQKPELKEQVNAVIKNRQEQLEIRFQAWVTDGQGEKNADDMKDWLSRQSDLLEDPIVYDDKTDSIPELRQSSDEFEFGAENAINFKPQPIPNQNRNAVFFTGEKARASARSGRLGRLDSETGVFLAPPEIKAYVELYEKTGQIDPLVRDLATQADVTPREFLGNQAKLWGMPGQINDPEPTVVVSPVTKRVSQQDAMDFAINQGLSRRGAVWFSHVMIAESGGNPKAEHDRDENGEPTGYGLFAHRLSRRDALFAFAQDQGKDKSDPTVQMQFAMSELRAYKDHPQFGHVWAAITAANPSDKQLVAAQKSWMRYHSSLHEKRKQALIDDLNRY